MTNSALFQKGYGVCGLSVVPVRLAPDSRSEMTSQARLGESVRLLEEGPDSFVRVECLVDGYEGWVDGRQFAPADAPEPAPRFLTDEPAGVAAPVEGGGTRHPLLLPLGARLPEWDGRVFRTGGVVFTWAGAVREVATGGSGDGIVEYARRFFGTPYLWGGRSVFGIDCSGYVQTLWAAFGVALPRDSMRQALCGEAVEGGPAAAEAGDLAFFHDGENVTHTGLCAGDGTILHSSGRVRLDGLTEDGIRNAETGELTHRLHCVRRVRTA